MRPATLAVALLGLAACAGDDDPGTVTDLTACEGAGAPVVEAGTGNASNFVAFVDDDVVAVVNNGEYGFSFDIVTAGLDTTAPISALVRFSVGGELETTDLIANLNFQCGDEGLGWTQVWARLGDEYQDALAVSYIDGFQLDLSTSLTDQVGESDTHAVTLQISLQ